ncbi:MAG: CPBP family intramembrane metalloprotease [Actinomycetales bacterium]|nr:CPBP family intramembrane metalloprotease [Actinomycetales bacterium]
MSAVDGAVGWYPGCPVTVDEAIARGRSLRRPRWGLWDVLIALVATVAIGYLASIALPGVTGDDPPPGPLLVAVVVPWLGLAGWPVIATAWRGNGPRIDLGIRMTWRDAGLGGIGGVAAWVALGAIAAVTVILTGRFNSSAGEVAVDFRDSGSEISVIAFALVVAIGAPLMEELAFRGLFYSALRKRGVGTGWTIAITAVSFAAFHFEPIRLPILLAMGVVLGVLRWRTRGIGAPFVAHVMVNAPGAVLIVLGLPSLG